MCTCRVDGRKQRKIITRRQGIIQISLLQYGDLRGKAHLRGEILEQAVKEVKKRLKIFIENSKNRG